MPCIRVICDLAFDADAAGVLTRPGAAAAVAALRTAIANARGLSCWVTGAESSAEANEHLCHHPEGQPCPEAEVQEIGVRPVKRIAVPLEIGEAEPLPIGGEIVKGGK
jgi:hypothetical protein